MRGGAVVEERHRRHAEAGVVDVDVPLPLFVVDQVPARLAVVRNERVEEHQRIDPAGMRSATPVMTMPP